MFTSLIHYFAISLTSIEKLKLRKGQFVQSHRWSPRLVWFPDSTACMYVQLLPPPPQTANMEWLLGTKLYVKSCIISFNPHSSVRMLLSLHAFKTKELKA